MTITINQGNTYSITYSIKNTDGSSKDLSGTQELKYGLSRRRNTTELLSYTLDDSELSIAGSDVTIKLVNSVINPLPEGSYYHEMWQVNALGDPTTIMSEKISIASKLIKE
jgi:hypothetical protein